MNGWAFIGFRVVAVAALGGFSSPLTGQCLSRHGGQVLSAWEAIQRIRKLIVPGLALALSLVLVGACTDSGNEIHLIAGESIEDPGAMGYAFADEDITRGAPTITVQAGEEVTITLENVHGRYFGRAGRSHDLAIFPDTDQNRKNPRIDPEFSEEVLWDVWLGAEMGVLVGDTETVTFVPDEPGRYIYVCTIDGHIERGMLGEFIVEGG